MTSGTGGEDDIFLVFVDGKPGREAAFATWFTGSHMADMRALPGVSSAHAFRVAHCAGPPPAKLCAIYEFSGGAAVLDTIGRSKGTDALPQSEDQGRMVWRLFETVACRPSVAIPIDADIVVALLESPREHADPTPLVQATAAIMAMGAAYARALRLSPIQPSRGSGYGVGLIAALDDKARAIETLNEKLDLYYSGVARSVVRLIRGNGDPRPR